MDEKKYKMIISLNALNHLGINLYSNIPAVLSEIVANAWDADATRVDINYDTQNDWIEIKDNGIGMSLEDINNKFLFVGYQKRNEATESKIYKRKFMGRKGIGKLSMFSIANTIKIITKTKDKDNNYSVNGFLMDVSKIKEAIGEENAENMNPYYPDSINVENCDIEETGTIVRLTDIKKTIYSNLDSNLKKRLSRRFTIFDDQLFEIYINGEKVKYEDRDYFGRIQYLWVIGNDCQYDKCCNADVKMERIDGEIELENKQYNLSGWIGTVKNADMLKDGSENINKISIIVRGKLALEDILNEYSEGGLYSKYLIGEINADFLDIDDEKYEDISTSSRQDLKKDDSRFIMLKEKIQGFLKEIQRKWTALRIEEGTVEAKSLVPGIQKWLDKMKGDNLDYAKKLLGKINQLTLDDDKKKEIIKGSVLAFEKLKYKNLLSSIDKIDATNLEIFSDIFNGIDDIEESMYYQIISERLQVIKTFKESIIDNNKLEKVIQEYLFNHLWLMDPSWERVKGTEHKEERIEKALKETCESLSDDERKGRIDLCYRVQSGRHIIIELKRPDRVIKLDEAVRQINKYRATLNKVLNDSNRKNEAFEIILLVGKDIDSGDDNSEVIFKTLQAQGCRVMKYNEMIDNAYNAYEEFLKQNVELNDIIELMIEIDDLN